jgi:aryl-alcohol dehydrogenase-like predicted oxidoreductase
MVHCWDNATPLEETMRALDDFVRDGKVRYIGCSNFLASQIVEAQWAASRSNGTPLVANQSEYSLILRDIEYDLLPAARRHGLGVMAYSPLAVGVLAARYERNTRPTGSGRLADPNALLPPEDQIALRRRYMSDRAFDIVEVVTRVAKEIDCSPAQVGIAWVLSRPGIVAAVVGPRTLDHLLDALKSVDVAMPADAERRLSQVSEPAGIYPSFLAGTCGGDA